MSETIMKKMPYRYKDEAPDFQKVLETEMGKLRAETDEKIKKISEVKDTEITKITGERNNLTKMIEDIKKQRAEANVFCPTCIDIDEHGHEHKHAMKETKPGLFECTGPDCNSKKILVDLESDYECDNCKLPVKKPKNVKVALGVACPWCGSKGKMKEKDWKGKLEQLKKKVGAS